MKDNQGRERGDYTNALADDEVAACPECDDANVETGYTGDVRSRRTDTKRYLCLSCHAQFDEFVIRERRHDSPPGGLAGRLLDADPDEVSK